ncbi:MAG: asparaginase [Pseudomonadota bacterium]
MSNPVLVNTWRGDVVENRHRGTVVVCDPRGRVVFSHGDVDELVYPRSSIKSLQAIPLVESGAADHYGLRDIEIALACSSHNAEPEHTRTVNAWLEQIGLDENDLECGAHEPLNQASAKRLIEDAITPTRVHNNCSGKHAGMLTCARFHGQATQGYIERDHPSQQAWFDVLDALADIESRNLPWNYDGCGIPVVAMPLRAVATAFARFAAPDDLSAARADASARIADAVAAQPFMVAGNGRLCTELMKITGRRVAVKTGAQGVFTASIPDMSLGVALKIDDGSTVASEVALIATLQHVNALSADETEELRNHAQPAIHNTRDVLTGHSAPSNVWDLHA